MHLLVFILVLVNLLFFAYGQGYLGQAENPDKVRLQQQLNAEKIKLLSVGEPPAPPKPETPPPASDSNESADKTGQTSEPGKDSKAENAASPAKTPDSDNKATSAATAAVSKLAEASKDADSTDNKGKAVTLQCLSWTTTDKEKAETLKRSLLKQFSPQSVQLSSIASSEAQRWWVYLPPFPDTGTAEQQMDKLKQAGLQDYSLITAEGQNRLAVSLGLFSSEEGARQRQKELASKGIRTAQIQARGKPGQYVLEARIPDTRSAEVKASASKLLPADSKQKTCKA